MGARTRITLFAAATLTIGALAGSSSPAAVPDVPWSSLLPALPSSNDVQPRPVKGCRKPTVRCVNVEVRKLRKLRNRLGCDHRAVFATTYLELTKQIRDDIRSGFVKHNLRSPRYLYTEDALFANFYFRVVRRYKRGLPVPEAWRIAFEAAASNDKAAVQDMLLGINAHVQNDMPFVLASLGLRDRKGNSRKPDHDAMNGALTRGYERVVKAVRDRYDPNMDLTNSPLIPLDDIAGLELTKSWREVVWRNAERIARADSKAELTQVTQSIEAYAAANARLIAAGGVPDYGTSRDAYCAAGPAGR